MFKNKLIAFLCLAVIILLALCSCGGLDEPDKSKSPFKDVLDGHAEAYAELPSWAPDTVMNMFRITEKNANGRFLGTIVTVKVGGYADFIFMTVGIDSDGNITKVVINKENETHGSAGMKNYPDVFAGVSSDELSGVDTYSRATVSSTAIKNGVIDAMKAVMGNESVTEPEPEEVLPKTDAEIKAIAATLMGVDATSFTNVTPDKSDFVKRVYKSSKGYAVYTVTNDGGGSMDTETLIHIDDKGKVAGIEKLAFITSPAIYGYNPPTEADIDALYDRLVGATSSTLAGVDAVTGATNTTNTLKGALTEALAAVAELIRQDLPTPEFEIKDIAASLMGVNSTDLEDVTPANTTLVKRVYKCARGYAVYAITAGGWGGSMDTESVIWIGADGKIKGIEKLTFTTSPEMYGFIPPSETEINAFYNRLVGVSSSTVSDVDIITGATHTSSMLKNAISEALSVVENLKRN